VINDEYNFDGLPEDEPAPKNSDFKIFVMIMLLATCLMSGFVGGMQGAKEARSYEYCTLRPDPKSAMQAVIQYGFKYSPQGGSWKIGCLFTTPWEHE